MATDIEWSDESWNPIRARLRSDPTVIGWHCEHASPGCEHCYSETRNRSGRCNMGTKLLYKPGHRKEIEVFLDEAQLLKPLRWKKGRKVFVCSMTDLFADFVPDAMIDRIFAVMALCPQHTFQVLTKRSARMREYMNDRHDVQGRWITALESVRSDQSGFKLGDALEHLSRRGPLRNVWLGVSVEDQQRADERREDFRNTPAAVKFVSYEPALGYVNWAGWSFVDQIIAGGESGPKARPPHPQWFRDTNAWCAAEGVHFFFKQWGQSCPLRAELIPVERRNIGWVARDGRFKFDCREADHKPMYRDDDRYGAGYWSQTVRVGKKRAGRLLDGVEHNGMPGQA